MKKPLDEGPLRLHVRTRHFTFISFGDETMVLGKLIGKSSSRENLGAAATFQSFDDDCSEIGQLAPSQRVSGKPSTMKRRAHTVGEVAHGHANERLSSPSGRQRPSILRAPSFEKANFSGTGSDEIATDQQSSESERSDGSSSWSSYGVDDIPEQFHMSSVNTVNAPLQFVVPTSLDMVGETEEAEEGSDSNSSILFFTPILGNEYRSESEAQDEEESREVKCDQDFTNASSNSRNERLCKERLRHTKKHHGSRYKRRFEGRYAKGRISEPSEESQKCPINAAASAINEPTASANVSQDGEKITTLSPYPRSPAKNLRNFKRTVPVIQVNDAQASERSDCPYPRTPGSKTLKPLSRGITCPKTNEQLPMLNPLDGTNPSATPTPYAVDLHRQTPVKQRQKYVLADNVDNPTPPIEMVGRVTGQKAPSKGSRRGSLQHVQWPSTTKQQRRLSCPTSNSNDERTDDGGADDAFHRVIGLIDSHTQRAKSGDLTEVLATPSRRKKSTVNELKRKIQKDRERIEERKLQYNNVEAKRAIASRRITSPRRTGKRVACRRQLVSVALDLDN